LQKCDFYMEVAICDCVQKLKFPNNTIKLTYITDSHVLLSL